MNFSEIQLDKHLSKLDNESEKQDAIDELSTKLFHAAFNAMRQEMSISCYAGKTTAADMSAAIDEDMFDVVADKLMKIIDKG